MINKELNKYIEKITIELKLRGNSKLTIKSYLFFLKPFLKNNENMESISLDRVKIYLASLIDRYSNKSRSLAVSSLRFFFKRIVDRPDIFVKLEVPKKEKRLPTVLTPLEVSNLIDAAYSEKSKLIIQLLYSSGVRVSELVNLTPEDIDLNQKIGWVRRGKGAKDRMFKLANSLISDLEILISENKSYLFSKKEPLSTRNVQLIVKKAAKRAGINKKVTPHTLRHSFATHLLEDGANLLVIQQLLGHENLETTRIYTHISQDQIKNVVSPLDTLNKKD